MAVFVAGDPLEALGGEVLGEALSHHDHAVLLALLLLANPHRLHDPADHRVDVHHRLELRLAIGAGDRLLAAELAVDVLHADHEARLSGNGGPVREPTGTAAHRLAEEVGTARLRVVEQVADLTTERVDGREVAEREIDAHVVVVDRLRQVHDRDPLGVGRQAVLVELELVGRFERVVATDRDQRLDAQRPEPLVGVFQRLHPLGILEVARMRDVLARIGAGGADHDALAAAGAFEEVGGDLDVVAALHERLGGREIGERRIAVLHADHLGALAHERGGRRRDHGVGTWGRAAGEQDRDAAKVMGGAVGTGERFGHRGLLGGQPASIRSTKVVSIPAS